MRNSEHRCAAKSRWLNRQAEKRDRIELGSIVYQQIDGTTGSLQSSYCLPSPGFQRIGCGKTSQSPDEDLNPVSARSGHVVSMDTTLPITEGTRDLTTLFK